MNLKIPIDSNFTCIIYCKIFDFVSITRNLYRVKLLSQNYLANGYTSKLESEKTGRRYLDPLAEILRSNFIGLLLAQGRILCYVARVENASEGAFLPNPSSLSVANSRNNVKNVRWPPPSSPSFPCGLFTLPLPLNAMADQRFADAYLRIGEKNNTMNRELSSLPSPPPPFLSGA